MIELSVGRQASKVPTNPSSHCIFHVHLAPRRPITRREGSYSKVRTPEGSRVYLSHDQREPAYIHWP